MSSTGKSTQDGLSPGREELGELYRRRLNRGRATLGEMFGGHIETRSQGAWVYTSEGRRFLNCGGYGVLLMGACHPTVIRHVSEQLHRHPVATRVFLEPQAALAADALVAVAPPGLERVHFAGSGAEAVETAIKMARTRGHRRLVSTVNGYHGKTMGALSLTGRSVFQEPFRPLLPGVDHVPYGETEALEKLLSGMPGEACVIVEPVQGEAGVVIPPDDYLPRVQELCRSYGAFFVLDEVQTGLGRLGTWWGADRAGSPRTLCWSARGSAAAWCRSPPSWRRRTRSRSSTAIRICTPPPSPALRSRWPPPGAPWPRSTRTISSNAPACSARNSSPG